MQLIYLPASGNTISAKALESPKSFFKFIFNVEMDRKVRVVRDGVSVSAVISRIVRIKPELVFRTLLDEAPETLDEETDEDEIELEEVVPEDVIEERVKSFSIIEKTLPDCDLEEAGLNSKIQANMQKHFAQMGEVLSSLQELERNEVSIPESEFEEPEETNFEDVSFEDETEEAEEESSFVEKSPEEVLRAKYEKYKESIETKASKTAIVAQGVSVPDLKEKLASIIAEDETVDDIVSSISEDCVVNLSEFLNKCTINV